MPGQRIAVVHDWLDTWRGGENVLAAVLDEYPDSDLYALVDFLPDAARARLHGKRAHTSFVQHLPFARRHFRRYLPILPLAVRSLDLSGHDLVISISHAFAKGVRMRAGQRHLCYCNTPIRYAWDLREQYLSMTGLTSGGRGLVARALLDRLKAWDVRTTAGVDRFAANSRYIAERIARAYGRSSTVIHPPVDVDFYTPAEPAVPLAQRGYYLTASRWVPYKRLDLVVEAFATLPHRLVVAGDGPEAANVRRHATASMSFPGEVSRADLRTLLRGARAFVFPAEEDFGILPVEAQACGTPVIAYGKGGARETVRADAPRSGLFFDEQSAAAVAAAVAEFESRIDEFDPAACRANAEPFGARRFARELRAFVAGDPGQRTQASTTTWPAAC